MGLRPTSFHFTYNSYCLWWWLSYAYTVSVCECAGLTAWHVTAGEREGGYVEGISSSLLLTLAAPAVTFKIIS